MDIFQPKTIEWIDIDENNLNDDSTSNWNHTIPYTVSTSGAAVTEVQIPWESDRTTPIIPRLYELISDSAIGHYPPDYPSEWQDNGVTSKYAMFDGDITTVAAADGTESTDPGKIVFKVNTSKLDRMTLFGLSATDVKFELYDSTPALINTTEYNLMDGTPLTSWKPYFFDDRTYARYLIHEFTLLHVSSMRVTITDSRTGYYPSVGLCLPSRARYIGQTLKGIQTSVISLGNGIYQDVAETDIRVRVGTMPYVQQLLADLYGLPVVFQGNNASTSYGNLILAGKYESFRQTHHNFNDTVLRIKMLGLERKQR